MYAPMPSFSIVVPKQELSNLLNIIVWASTGTSVHCRLSFSKWDAYCVLVLWEKVARHCCILLSLSRNIGLTRHNNINHTHAKTPSIQLSRLSVFLLHLLFGPKVRQSCRLSTSLHQIPAGVNCPHPETDHGSDDISLRMGWIWVWNFLHHNRSVPASWFWVLTTEGRHKVRHTQEPSVLLSWVFCKS
jgi:hypothetical protein